jgi:hypothetical protein
MDVIRGVLAAIAALSFNSVASAASYNLGADAGSATFQYGQGDAATYASGSGSSFLSFANIFACGTGGLLECRNSGSSPYPYVAINPTAVDYVTPDDNFTAHGIFLESGYAGTGADSAVIRFTTPDTGSYALGGQFIRLEVPNGDGATVSVYKVSGGTATALYSQLLASGPQLSSLPFNLGVSLSAGDYLDFVVSGNGTIYSDTTGVEGIIQTATIPEPATWAMTIGGFGMIGGALRRRSKMRIAFIKA